MARKKALWRELGLKPVTNEKGSRLGFYDKDNNYIPERQYRKLAGTPMKGSAGHKERQAAKKIGKDFRPMTEKQVYKEMQKAAKKPGMTLEEFMTGQSRELAYSERRTTEAHNRFIDSERRNSIDFKKMAGTLTEKQAATAHKDLDIQIKAREKAIELRDKMEDIHTTTRQRTALEKQYQTQINIIRKQQAKLEKKGVVILDELPSGESLRYGYYH